VGPWKLKKEFDFGGKGERGTVKPKKLICTEKRMEEKLQEKLLQKTGVRDRFKGKTKGEDRGSQKPWGGIEGNRGVPYIGGRESWGI